VSGVGPGILAEALGSLELEAVVRERAPLPGGGPAVTIERVPLADGSEAVCKHGPADHEGVLREELAGLRRLEATGTVRVPRTHGVALAGGRAVLAMEHLAEGPAADGTWGRFAEELTSLHAVDAGDRYGFEIDNHCGPTPQPNGWCASWVEFNRRHRIGHQLELLKRAGRIDGAEAAELARVIDALGTVLDDRPRPSLLHGDLWSGNALPTAEGRIALIDPAPSIGDALADLAMMELFGGFDPVVLGRVRASAGAGLDESTIERRLAVYRLYHLLNHVTIFGRGYWPGVRRTMSAIMR